jgi:hypothetical protein
MLSFFSQLLRIPYLKLKLSNIPFSLPGPVLGHDPLPGDDDAGAPHRREQQPRATRGESAPSRQRAVPRSAQPAATSRPATHARRRRSRARLVQRRSDVDGPPTLRRRLLRQGRGRRRRPPGVRRPRRLPGAAGRGAARHVLRPGRRLRARRPRAAPGRVRSAVRRPPAGDVRLLRAPAPAAVAFTNCRVTQWS